MPLFCRSYDRLGRFAVSVRYYNRAIELAAMLYTMYGEEMQDSSGMIYNALKAQCMILTLPIIPMQNENDTMIDKIIIGERESKHAKKAVKQKIRILFKGFGELDDFMCV